MVLKTHKEAVEAILKKVGPDLRIGTPLGLGKPNQLINAIYDRVFRDSSLSLTIFTALSLEIPETHNEIERRFAEPFYLRHFGDRYPALKYARDLRHGTLPANITVHEFYTAAGQYLNVARAQQDYTSLNYTHAARAIADRGINVLVQLVAPPRGPRGTLSLSCNSDLTLDLADIMKAKGTPFFKVAVLHPDLPYLGGEAEVSPDFFDLIVDTDELHQPLFSLPRTHIGVPDHLIGLHASRLIKDHGTLQIGIGSLSDALVHATILRQSDNALYRDVLKHITPLPQTLPDKDLNPFADGLYGVSEMIMDGFMHLRKAGILKREIKDKHESKARYLHGGFFLGSRAFYQWLRDLKGADFDGVGMTRISKINDLYDDDERSLRRQRINARFFNTCAAATVLGGAASDTLPNGQVLSGVGGQYNFVAEAAELEGARSVLMLRSTRKEGSRLVSNIVIGHPHLTIPRHLRDIFVTEYGVADLRARSDQECCEAMIEIADSAFQADLIAQAQRAFKLRKDYRLPAHARNNTAAHLRKIISENRLQMAVPKTPFGSDFTEVEQRLETALLLLKSASTWQRLLTIARGLGTRMRVHHDELVRMGLLTPHSPLSFIYQRLVLGALDLQQRREAAD